MDRYCDICGKVKSSAYCRNCGGLTDDKDKSPLINDHSGYSGASSSGADSFTGKPSIEGKNEHAEYGEIKTLNIKFHERERGKPDLA